MNKLYSYKEAFSFRVEIGAGACLNIEVEIDVVHKNYFSLGHICKGGQTVTGWGNEKTVSSWYIKRRLFQHIQFQLY